MPKTEINLNSQLPSTTVASALRWAVEVLAEAGVETPRLDAECLLAHAVGLSRLGLYTSRAKALDPVWVEAFEELVGRRAGREPLAYILGEREFWSLSIKVGPSVLIPRPETEVLVETALERLRQLTVHSSQFTEKNKDHQPSAISHQPIVVEIGTGSGAISIALAQELPEVYFYATELSPEAIQVASENIERYSLSSRVLLLQGDLFSPLSLLGLEGNVDMVVSNPPYIPRGHLSLLPPEVLFEPVEALDGSVDGLYFHKRIIIESPRFLKPGGWLALEIGADQGRAVTCLLEDSKEYRGIEVVQDYAGKDRVVLAQKSH
ncbi:MAG: peptide chain release factor N(5)-glutamine methyltransferase [candidate division NC10 bacterium]|nr:peptide chain release factor N(5)-glutamine methyltransferase [candidate division NC10 bacterium]